MASYVKVTGKDGTTVGLLDNILGGGGGNPLSELLGEHSGLVGGALQALAGGSGGSLAGLVSAFEQNGLGQIVKSWVGTGQNLPISAQQIQQVLGSDRLQGLASQFGLTTQAAGAKLADLLPTLIDRLTPDGNLPTGGDLLGGLSSLFGNRGA
ncbi:MAG: YidB family protein [Acidobacteriota bacterium]